jgi:hypothetical protein
MLVIDLQTQIDKPREFKSGPVVNETHKPNADCSSKEKGSLESKGRKRSVCMQRLRKTSWRRHAEKR